MYVCVHVCYNLLYSPSPTRGNSTLHIAQFMYMYLHVYMYIQEVQYMSIKGHHTVTITTLILLSV